MEEFILKTSLNCGLGACGGFLAAWLYLKFRIELLVQAVKILEKKHKEDVSRLSEDNKEVLDELRRMNNKLDSILEYRNMFQALARKIQFGGLK